MFIIIYTVVLTVLYVRTLDSSFHFASQCSIQPQLPHIQA